MICKRGIENPTPPRDLVSIKPRSCWILSVSRSKATNNSIHYVHCVIKAKWISCVPIIYLPKSDERDLRYKILIKLYKMNRADHQNVFGK